MVMIYMYDVSKKKNCTNCFCKVFFKFSFHEIYNFWLRGDKIAEVVHSFSPSPYSCHHTTLLKQKVLNLYKTQVLYCIVLYSSIYITPLNSHRQTEALLVRIAPRKETSFKK